MGGGLTLRSAVVIASFMPLPPPPMTAFTSMGKPICLPSSSSLYPKHSQVLLHTEPYKAAQQKPASIFLRLQQ